MDVCKGCNRPYEPCRNRCGCCHWCGTDQYATDNANPYEFESDNSALMKDAEEWADGFCETAQKQTGDAYARNMGVANIIALLINALEREEKVTAKLREAENTTLVRLAAVISEGKKPSIYNTTNPEFDRGVDSAIEWVESIIEQEANNE